MSGSGEITSDGFMALGEDGSTHPSLQAVSLSWCKGLSDLNLERIAGSCPNLEFIDLSLCSTITDEGVAALGSLKRLKRLFLSRNKQITDKGLQCYKVPTPSRRLPMAFLHYLRITYGFSSLPTHYLWLFVTTYPF
jgi:hypothetical protein